VPLLQFVPSSHVLSVLPSNVVSQADASAGAIKNASIHASRKLGSR
jgi:hypothetical protein